MRIFVFVALVATIASCAVDSSSKSEVDESIYEKETQQERASSRTEESSDLFDALHDAIDQVEVQLKEATDEVDKDHRAEAVAYEELKSFLPRFISGMARREAKGERSGLGNFKISSASAVYEGGNQYLEVSIVDTGNLPFARLGYDVWADTDFVHESDEEYSRTTHIDGWKAFEEYNFEKEEGKIAVSVSDRFIVTIEGENISEKVLQRGIDKINLKGLAKL